jgi:hypothetical protein
VGGKGGGGGRREMTQALYAHMNNKTKIKKKEWNALTNGELTHICIYIHFSSVMWVT